MDDRQGNSLAELKGPKDTDGDFGFFKGKNGSRIILLWKRTGKVVMLDAKFDVVAQTSLSGTDHQPRIVQIGDFDGSKQAEILITNNNSATILDESLNTIFNATFPALITSAVLFPGRDGTARLAVCSGKKLYLLSSSGGRGTTTKALTPTRGS